MSGNRVFYACLGAVVIDKGQSSYINGAISASLSLTRNINTIMRPGKKEPVAIYSDLPDVQFTYSQYVDSSNFKGLLETLTGLNNYIELALLIGSDTSGGLFSGPSTILPSVTGSPATQSVGCDLALLSSIRYNLPVDGFFTIDKTYTGYSKKGTISNIPTFTESSAPVYRRQCWTGTLPAALNTQAVQNISIEYSINRQPIAEFATRKPYGFVTNFPIETTVNFDVLVQSLDNYSVDALESACQNPQTSKENISISVYNGQSISISDAYLTNISYNGGDANSNSNQTMSVSYTSYNTASAISPFVLAPPLSSNA